MQRRTFLQKSALAAGATMAASQLSANPATNSKKDFYELKVFQLRSGSGRNQLKKYYEQAVIPLFDKFGSKVGAFNEFSQEDPPKVYILHAHKSPEDYLAVLNEMKTNKSFIEASESYTNLPSDRPVYERYETFIADAFDGIPQFKKPAKDRGLFELRIYESYNEDAGHRKVKMFNDEELPLFEKVGLHPVFFGQLLGGRYMPALAYMLWFKDMDQRNANWDVFRKSKEWDIMKVKPEYANTVSKVRKIFLTPMDFSQI